jgi:DNA-binding transcriptional ArsR family regulator
MALNQTLSALSEPNRRKIIDILKKREMPVSDILSKMDITMATLSHHLDVLRRADLVSSRRDGQQIFYSLNLSVMEELAEQIFKFLSK